MFTLLFSIIHLYNESPISFLLIMASHSDPDLGHYHVTSYNTVSDFKSHPEVPRLSILITCNNHNIIAFLAL